MIKKLTYEGIFRDTMRKEIVDKINEIIVAVNLQHIDIKSAERRHKK